MRRLVLGLALCAAGCVLGCSGTPPPEPFECADAPAEATITDLAIGTAPFGFRPLADGANLYTTVGEDGSELASIRAGWRGAEAPACGRVRIFVFDPGSGRELVDRVYQLDSIPNGDWRVSGDVFFDADGWPPEVVVEITIYGMTLRRTLVVGGFMVPDAGF